MLFKRSENYLYLLKFLDKMQKNIKKRYDSIWKEDSKLPETRQLLNKSRGDVCMIHYNKLGRNARKALAGLLVAANVVGGVPVYAAEPTEVQNPSAVEAEETGESEQEENENVADGDEIPSDAVDTTTDDTDNTEVPPVDDAADTEIPPVDDATDTEVPPADDATDTEVPPADDATDTEVPPADDATDTEVPPADDVTDTEVPPANDVTDTEVPPADDATNTEVPPEGDATDTEVPPADDATNAEMPSTDVVTSPDETVDEPMAPAEVTDEITVDSEILEAEEDGWHEDGNGFYYVESGEKLTSSWKQIDGSWYYLGSNGYRYANGQKSVNKDINGESIYSYYRFDTDGRMQTGWYEDEYGSKYYYMDDGKAAQGVLEIDGATYYFYTGRMQTDYSWSDEKNIYYFGEDGKLTETINLETNGWKEKDDGNWVYIEAGQMIKNSWKEIEGVRYYFDYYGNMCKDTVMSIWDESTGKSGYYRFDSKGKVVTGWYQDEEENWYYYGNDGMASEGMQKIGNSTYYFLYEGRMATNYTYEKDSGLYYFGEDGKMVSEISLTKNGWKSTADGSWYYTESGKLVKNEWRQIGKFWYRFDYDGKMLKDTSWSERDETTGKYTYYRFDKDGHMMKGWYYVGETDRWYYYDSKGAAVDGLVTIGKDVYYFSNRIMQTKTVYSDEKNLYYFNEDGKLTEKISIEKDGWKKNKEGDWFYVESGKLVKGWRQIGGSKYYFGSDGVMYRDVRRGIGFDPDDPGTNLIFSFDEDGRMVTGWYQSRGKWYYHKQDGTAASGLQTIGKKTYCFSGEGEMLTNGQYYKDGVLYVYGADGVCTTSLKNGWLYDTYYIVKGKAVTGWREVSGKWYYFDPGSGKKAENKIMWIEGKSYSFDSDGVMNKGWVKVTGNGELHWMYADGSGALVKDSWQKLGKKWYYFDGSGEMVTGLKEIDGKLEKFNADGLWTGTASNNAWYEGEGGSWFYIKDKAMLKDVTEQIKGKYYHFDSSGRMVTREVHDDYYFGSNGAAVKNQWRLDSNGKWHYYGADSKEVEAGWKKIGSSWYYFVSGTIVTEDCVIDGKLYRFKKNGASDKKEVKITDGWNLIDGQYYYYKGGSYLTGLQKIGNARYYFDFDGRMAYQSRVGAYFADKNGKIISKAWGQDADGTYYYAGADGRLVKGLQTIGGKKYLFNEHDGAMYEHDMVLSNDEKTLYVISSSGEVTRIVKAGKNGWTKTANDNWFYVSGGKFAKGYQTIGGKSYYFYSTGMATDTTVSGHGYADANGVLHLNGWYGEGSLIYVRNGHTLSGPGTVSGKKYYFSYIADTGLYFADGNYYFFDGSKGTRKTYKVKEGWNKVNGLWYYVIDGAVQTGSQEIGGKYYHFSDNGVMLSDCLYSSDGRYQYLDENGLPVKNSWKKVSYMNIYRESNVYDEDDLETEDVWYYFDANGFAVTGKQKIGGKTYIFAENGKML